MRTFKLLIVVFFLLGLSLSFGCVKAQSNDNIKDEITKLEEAIHDTLPVQIIVNKNAKVEIEEDNDSLKTSKKKEEVDINGLFFINLAIDLITVFIIVFLIYYPNNRRQEYIFTFVLFNIVIFLLTYVLNEVKISMGAAFGLFAVFSMLRYRTAGISMKDMTYLFIFIAIGLLSAIHLEYYENIAINSIIIILTFALDSRLFFKRFNTQKIDYDNTDLLKPENREKLIADLRQRTGLKIYDVSIGRIDFLKNCASIKVYYHD